MQATRAHNIEIGGTASPRRQAASVQGAGDVTFAGGRVLRISDQSGHYFPWLEDNADSFLQSGVNAFRNAGIIVPEEAIEPFGW
ncbi:hypothetical protein P8605_02365 [Streptomyces sp. T-3]|nr:hypothetical protein [Streptomyces sp. T-3]